MALLKITCPNNPRHKKFSVTGHITQLWRVDEHCNFVSVLKDCLDVTHRPDKDDRYVCMTCDAEAKTELS